VLAVTARALVIVPLWRFCLLPQNKSLRRSFVAVGSGLFRIYTGLWAGWHKDEISARLLRGTQPVAPSWGVGRKDRRNGVVLIVRG
jgi:hypothetical protein